MNIHLPRIVHIVRRFGCVGGMESYVWNLTHELVRLGLQIEIICEETFGQFDPNILIHRIPKSQPKPRWRSMQRFRKLVTQYVNDNFQSHQVLIHSHERSDCHHVTTFHGPPISSKTSFLNNLLTSRRVSAWRQMEKDELLSDSTVQILAVSSISKQQLLELYPEVTDEKIQIAHPGIHPHRSCRGSESSEAKPRSKKCIFVGTEWKRKGLILAVEIVSQSSPAVLLDIFGPSIEDLPDRIKNHPCVNVMGWKQTIPWEEYEVLIHPAKKEPFGMVVAEARAHGVKVLTSSEVGSVDLGFNDLVAIKLNAPLGDWVDALEDLTSESNGREAECLWTWSDLANLHKNEVYPKVFKALTNYE